MVLHVTQTDTHRKAAGKIDLAQHPVRSLVPDPGPFHYRARRPNAIDVESVHVSAVHVVPPRSADPARVGRHGCRDERGRVLVTALVCPHVDVVPCMVKGQRLGSESIQIYEFIYMYM